MKKGFLWEVIPEKKEALIHEIDKFMAEDKEALSQSTPSIEREMCKFIILDQPYE